MKTTALLLVLLTALLASAGTAPDFETGKLLDVSTEDRVLDGTSQRHALFTVQLGALIYTARGGRVSHRAGDYAQGLIVGDSVPARVDGNHLILRKPNGKELSGKIVRRERVKD